MRPLPAFAVSTFVARVPRLIKFGVVGASGLVVNTLALAFLADVIGIHYLLGAALATQASTLWNYFLTDAWVFDAAAAKHATTSRFAMFWALNNAALVLRLPLLWLLASAIGIHHLVANLMTLVIVMLARFWASDSVIWSPSPAEATAVSTGSATGSVALPRPRPPGSLRRIWLSTSRALERNWIYTIVTSMTVAAAAGLMMRVWDLSRYGLNSDEAVYSGQAATLGGIPGFAGEFSIFRAHPLLFEYALALYYKVFGFSEIGGRVISTVFGLGTVGLVYLIAARLVDRRLALVASTFLAVLPFHIIVVRQALLEATLTFFVTACMYAAVRYIDALDDPPSSRIPAWAWLVTAGALGGLAFMSKEAGAVAWIAVPVALAVSRRFHPLHMTASAAIFLAVISPHLWAMRVGHGSEVGGGWVEYLVWQISRPANHPPLFYLRNLPVYFGIPLLALLAIGIGYAWKQRSDARFVLLLTWLALPMWFFQIWKVKGFHYPVVIAPVVVILAAYAVVTWWLRYERPLLAFTSVVMAVTVASLVWLSGSNGGLIDNFEKIGEAGFSGIPGGREAALWLEENAPQGARVLTIGPSVANIIRFYSDHEASALSISPNPLRANPAYEAVRNPDYLLRWGLVEYIIYDAYSAERSPHFANRLLDYVERYGSTIVHQEFATRVGLAGNTYEDAVIRIYRVGPIG